MLRAIAFLMAMFFAQASSAQECQPDKISVRGAWGQAAFSVEIADTPELRARGLMFRESMPRLNGMLFVFPSPQRATFWMRNTLIPLDMIFAAEDGTIRTVHSNAIPGDETPIFGGDDIKYVFEINGGMAEIMGIQAGDVLRHPAIDPSLSAWPCDSVSTTVD